MAFRQTYPIRARSFLDPVSPRSYTNTADRKGRLVACKQYATLGDLAIPRLAFSPVKNNQKACLWLQKDLYYFRGEAWQICVDVVVLTIFSMILVSWWFTLNGQFTGTVDEDEIERLSRSTSDWWDVFGEFAPLHAMNKLRVPFVRMRSVEHGAEPNPSRPLSGLKILDAGCGGGILSEPLARLGANVTGIDASSRNINSALQHSSFDPLLKDKIQYRCTTIEELADEIPEEFDAVVSSEVIEHVSDKRTFIQSSAQLIKPGGSLFITTINRSQKSYVAGIIGAEYILRALTPGTHDWNKFITVEELQELVKLCGLQAVEFRGMVYVPFINRWWWCKDTGVNYAMHATKPRIESQDRES